MRYPHLFKPLTLNQLTLRNRIVSTAHAEVYAEPGGLPGDRYIRYYEEKAKGDVGLAPASDRSVLEPAHEFPHGRMGRLARKPSALRRRSAAGGARSGRQGL